MAEPLYDRPVSPADRKLGFGPYLASIGISRLPPRLSPFDPGYDPVTLEAHLGQSGHLIEVLKISMACWLIADESASRAKFAAARARGIPTTTGGGPFEVAVARDRLSEYLDVVTDVGATRIECGEGFTDLRLKPKDVVRAASERGLDVQYELGKKHTGAFEEATVRGLIATGHRWLEAGARQVVVEARESAQSVGLFGPDGALNSRFADDLANAFGLDNVVFEAPNKPSQFALLDHFGRDVHLCNVRLEEILRVEIYRRGLHSDSFSKPRLAPDP
jgi:phosphosulfolactate synthase